MSQEMKQVDIFKVLRKFSRVDTLFSSQASNMGRVHLEPR